MLYYISGSYRDTTFNLRLLNEMHVDGFDSELEAPNKVGKATEKRLQQWFDYLDTVEADKAEFVRIRDERIATFKKRLEETGLEVIWNGNNNGRIEKGMFSYKFELTEMSVKHGKRTTKAQHITTLKHSCRCRNK